MGIFGFKGSFGTGIALSGEPKTAINIWQRRVQELSAAKAAAKERAAKDEEKALDTLNDFIIKDPRKYTKFYQPLASKGYSEAINELYKAKVESPTNWTNKVTGIVVGLKEKLDNLANNSQNQRDIEEMDRQGMLVPDRLIQTWNDPKNYGKLDALYTLNDELPLYGGGVSEDGGVTIYPVKPVNASDIVSKFNKEESNFTQQYDRGTVFNNGIVQYTKTFEAPKEKINAFNIAQKTDPAFQITTTSKYSNILMAIPDPAQRQVRLNELMDMELSDVGKRPEDAILMNEYRSSPAGGASKEKMRLEYLVDTKYKNMVGTDAVSFISKNYGGAWAKAVIEANGNIEPPEYTGIFNKKGEVIANEGQTFTIKNINGDRLGNPGKRVVLTVKIEKNSSGVKKAVLDKSFTENDEEGISMSAVIPSGSGGESAVDVEGMSFNDTNVFFSADGTSNPMSWGELSKKLQDKNAIITDFKQGANGNIMARAVFNIRNGKKESWWVPYSKELGNAVLQKNPFFWDRMRPDEWFEKRSGLNPYRTGKSASSTPVQTPEQAAPKGKKKNNSGVGTALTNKARGK